MNRHPRRAIAALTATIIAAATLVGCAPADPSVSKAEELVTAALQAVADGHEDFASEQLGGGGEGALQHAVEHITNVRVGDLGGSKTLYDETTGLASVPVSYDLAGSTHTFDFTVLTGPGDAPAEILTDDDHPRFAGTIEGSGGPIAVKGSEYGGSLLPAVYSVAPGDLHRFTDGGDSADVAVTPGATEQLPVEIDTDAILAVAEQHRGEIDEAAAAQVRSCLEDGVYATDCRELAPSDYLSRDAPSELNDFSDPTRLSEAELVYTGVGLSFSGSGTYCEVWDMRATHETGRWGSVVRETVIRSAVEAQLDHGSFYVSLTDPEWCLDRTMFTAVETDSD